MVCFQLPSPPELPAIWGRSLPMSSRIVNLSLPRWRALLVFLRRLPLAGCNFVDLPVDASPPALVDSVPLSDGLVAASQPYVGRWNKLVSTTNWEKGRIIVEWRESLAAQGLPVSEYSDDAWSRLVGGVTGQHAGRLRRVY